VWPSGKPKTVSQSHWFEVLNVKHNKIRTEKCKEIDNAA